MLDIDGKLPNQINDEEWQKIFLELRKYVEFYKGFKTFDIHDPDDIVMDAFQKLLSGERPINFNKHNNIYIKLKSTIDSILYSKYRDFKNRTKKLEAFKESNDEIEVEKSEFYDLLLDHLKAFAKNDEDIEYLLLAIEEGCQDYDDICSSLGWDKKKISAVRKKVIGRYKKEKGNNEK